MQGRFECRWVKGWDVRRRWDGKMDHRFSSIISILFENILSRVLRNSQRRLNVRRVICQEKKISRKIANPRSENSHIIDVFPKIRDKTHFYGNVFHRNLSRTVIVSEVVVSVVMVVVIVVMTGHQFSAAVGKVTVRRPHRAGRHLRNSQRLPFSGFRKKYK